MDCVCRQRLKESVAHGALGVKGGAEQGGRPEEGTGSRERQAGGEAAKEQTEAEATPPRGVEPAKADGEGEGKCGPRESRPVSQLSGCTVGGGSRCPAAAVGGVAAGLVMGIAQWRVPR